MNLTMQGGDELSFTSISNCFIDELMTEANDAQIKIYLFLVRSFSAKKAVTVSDLADRFNHTEKDVLRALRFWEKKGILSLQYSADGALVGISLTSLSSPPSADIIRHPAALTPALDIKEAIEAADTQGKKASKPMISKKDIAAFTSDADIQSLLFIVENYLGHPLTMPELRSLFHIYVHLSLSTDVIDLLVQYCALRGKLSMSYIEKVAQTWSDDGITSAKLAKAQIKQYQNSLKKTSQGTAALHNFEQRDYDFDLLEKQLRSN